MAIFGVVHHIFFDHMYRRLTEPIMNAFPLLEGIYPTTREYMKTLLVSFGFDTLDPTPRLY